MVRIRMALVLLTAWVALSVGVWLIASLNFHTADRVSEPGKAPTLEAHLAARTSGAPLGLADVRPVVRFLASEINRTIFRTWGAVQLWLALAVIALVVTEPALALWGKVTALGGSGLGILLGLVLTPMLRGIGPPLDFVPRPVPPEFTAAHQAFLRIHGAYVVLDLVKAALLLVALVAVFRVRERSRYGDVGPGA